MGPGPDQLADLVRRVFAPTAADSALAVLVDLPDARLADTPAWAERRALAFRWALDLQSVRRRLGLERVDIVLYRNAGTNNADLPEEAWVLDARGLEGEDPPSSVDEIDPQAAVSMERVFAYHDLILAPTQLSATAPLKLAARRHGFRAASMPRFSPAMIPALALDWEEVDRRCRRLKELVDDAIGARFVFEVGGGARHELRLDLRHRTGHASGGLLREPSTAGNLPSGETYIVPYEGEVDGDPSCSAGVLPVQLDPSDDEVVLYRIEENRAVEVLGDGPAARSEAARLAAEPAYGNLAELGLGVLADWGVEPVGEILLDEKLGLHIAFGRSDHFGGQVGVAQFSAPEHVVHIDRVYLPVTQPRIRVPSVDLELADGSVLPLLRDGRYQVGI